MIPRAFVYFAFAAMVVTSRAAAAEVKTVHFGWTNVVPITVVLKNHGWLEEQLKPLGITVDWVQSDGSNRTLEFLRAKAIDFGSSAASAALLGRANGNPVNVIYFALRGESTAILTRGDAPFHTLAELKGHKIAATRGTEPFIFALRALQKNGIAADQVEFVPLQHPDGRAALETGRVDAWAALDPDFSIALSHGARFLYRDESLITGGVIDVREEFARESPEVVSIVLAQLEHARSYLHAHTDEVLQQFADGIHQPLDVARAAFERADIDHPQIGPGDYVSIEAAGESIKQTGTIPPETDVKAVTAALLAPVYLTKVVQK
jgi:sulfonate transport system substrate-binding protein